MSLALRYDLPDGRLDELLALFRDYEWWDDRAPDDLRRAVEHTDALVLVEDTDEERLVAAARVLSDLVYYATVRDVIVAADRRGEGVGERLMAGVRDHPDLRDCPGLSLLCREGLVPFYESVGFDRYDRDVDHPDGDPEPLVRMTHAFE